MNFIGRTFLGLYSNDSDPSSKFGISEAELPTVERLNSSLYEFSSSAGIRTPNVEVIFFHGLQPPGCVSKAYLHTWISTHGGSSFYWPQKLLADDFSEARLLSVSYDSCTTKTAGTGRIDIYLVAENLLQDLTQMEKGHSSGCPVILVGKDVGGLIIKAICLAADRNRSDNQDRYQSFLRDIRGILYYSTPHRGFINLSPEKFDGALFQNLGLLDANLARVSQEFSQLNRSKYNWKTRAIIGTQGIESELCIPENSLRDDVDRCYTVPQDLHSMARPCEKTGIMYSYLSELMSDAIRDHKPSSSIKERALQRSLSLRWQRNPHYVSLKESEAKIRSALEPDATRRASPRVVLLHGGPGRGKSTLAIEVSLSYKGEESVFTKVVMLDCGRGVNEIAKKTELLQKLGWSKKLTDGFKGDDSEVDLLLQLRLTNAKLLILLDDLWEPGLITSLLNLCSDGAKYLITSQVADLCKHIPVHPKHRALVPIEIPKQDDSRKILATCAGFESQCIPGDLLNLADQIIVLAEGNPMIMATVGEKLADGEVAWENVLDEFYSLLDDEASGAYHHGMSPRSFLAKLRISIIDSLDDQQKQLLVLIGMCKGASVPESALQLLYHSAISQASSQAQPRNVLSRVNDLKKRHLAQPEKDTGLISIPSLTKWFIIEEMRSTVEQVAALLKETLKEAAASASKIKFAVTNELVQRYIEVEFSAGSRAPGQNDPLLSFTQLLMPEPTLTNQLTKELSMCASKVYLEFILKDRLDDDAISKLLDSKASNDAAMVFLQDLCDLRESVWEKNSLQSTSKVLISLLNMLQDESSVKLQTRAASVLSDLCQWHENNAQAIVNVSGMLPQLGRALEQVHSSDLQLNVAMVLRWCAYWNVDTILSTLPNHRLPDKLVAVLYDSQTYDLQEASVNTLYYLANYLAKRLDRGVVANWPSLLEGLAWLLMSKRANLPYYAGWTLGNVASHEIHGNQEEFFNKPLVVDNLVNSLYVDQDSDLQQQAARTLRNLAEGSTRKKITVRQDVLEALKVALTKSGNAKLQYRAAETLAYMSDTNDKAMLEIVLNHPGLVDQLAKSLHEEQNYDLQVSSLETLRNMARHLDGSAVRQKIADWAGLLKGLSSFQKDDKLQKWATETRASLTATNEDTIVDTGVH